MARIQGGLRCAMYDKRKKRKNRASYDAQDMFVGAFSFFLGRYVRQITPVLQSGVVNLVL